MALTNRSDGAAVRARWATRDQDRAGVAEERIEVVDSAGETVLSLTLGQVYSLAGHLVEVGALVAESYPESIEGLLCEPAATAADLATVFDLGRRADLGEGPGRLAASRSV